MALRGLFKRRGTAKLERPSRPMRLLALAAVLVTIATVTDAEGWKDYLWAGWFLVAMVVLATAPRALFDGRLERWTSRHRLAGAGLIAGILFIPEFSLLAEVLSDRMSLVLAAIASGLIVVLSYTDKGPSSAVDDGPSTE